MKFKHLIPLAVCLTIASCGNNIQPLEVNYEVTPLATIEKYQKESLIPKNYSDYRVSELVSKFDSNSSLCLFDKIIICDKNKPETWKNEEVNYVFCNEIDKSILLTITDTMSTEDLLKKLQTSTAITYTDSDIVIPALSELKTLAKTAVYKDVFIKSLKEVFMCV